MRARAASPLPPPNRVSPLPPWPFGALDPPLGNFRHSPRLAARLTATVAASAGVGSGLVAAREVGLGWPPSLLARLLFGALVGWPLLVAFAKRRSLVLTAVVASGLCWCVGFLVSQTPVAVVVAVFLVWLTAALGTLALLDGEITADQRPLTNVPARSAQATDARRLGWLSSVMAVAAAVVLVAFLLPHLRWPGLGGGGSGTSRATSNLDDRPGGDRPGGDRAGSGRPGGQPDPWSTEGPKRPTQYHQWFDGLGGDLNGETPTTGAPGSTEAAPLDPAVELLHLSGPPVDRVRGLTLDRYADGSWHRSVLPTTEGSALSVVPLSLPSASLAATGTVDDWTVTIIQPGIEQLFAPADPVSVALAPLPGTDAPATDASVVYPAADGAVLFKPSLTVGTALVVSSFVLDPAEEALVQVPVGDSLPNGPDYLGAAALGRRGVEIGSNVRQLGTTVRQRQQAVEAFLASSTQRWRMDADPGGESDPLNAYLEGRPGTVSEIDAAAALLLRQAGVPTRLAFGYLLEPGDVDTRTGDQIVRAGGANAWVEVWYGEVGRWQRWEPALLVPWASPDSQAPAVSPASTQTWGQLLVWILVGGLAVSVGGGFLWWWRRRRARLTALAARPWAVAVLEGLEQQGASRGHHRRPAQTPAAYVEDIGASVLADPELAVLGATLSAELYSPHRPDQKARSQTEEIVRRAVTAAEAREKAARQARRAEMRAQLNPRRWLRRSRRRRTCPQTDLAD